jgi:hypothetical protein
MWSNDCVCILMALIKTSGRTCSIRKKLVPYKGPLNQFKKINFVIQWMLNHLLCSVGASE